MAIDDNTSYELTGYQVKDLATKVRGKADSSSLASVATSGLYSDLIGKPTIPTVNNATLTVTQNGTSAGTFTANASSDVTIALTDTTYTAGTGINITNNVISSTAGNPTTLYVGSSSNEYRFYYDAAKTEQVTYQEMAQLLEAQNVRLVQGNNSAADVVAYSIGTGEIYIFSYDSGMYRSYRWFNDRQYASLTAHYLQDELIAGSNITINNRTISATDTTYSAFTGATSGTAGTSGLVPAPAAGDESKVLSGAGTWVNQSGGSTYTAGNGISISANDEISIDTSVVAELSDLPTVNDGTLTIQHNGTTKGTFTANQSTASTVNIETIYADTPGTATTPAASVQASDIVWSTMPFNYSTTEVDTGCTWIDGSHIYRKTINFGALPNATAKSVTHGISSLGHFVDVRAIAWNSTKDAVTLSFASPSVLGGSMALLATSTGIDITTGSNRSSFSNCYVTLWYTKSS